ncbi:MAG: hypothetical protein MUF21_15190 [Gemmatimonadaceae bacterium]|nr:hypothetical protein [Gemmatimonadaceae bacterium]
MKSVSGIRGRVGEGLVPEVVATYAAGFGAWALSRTPGRPVVVGRDSRVSGPLFHRIVLSALESVGAHVIDLGVVPTPTVQLAVEHHHAAGGLAITASHNPIEWNALKFVGPSGLFLDSEDAAAMRGYTDGGFPRATWDRLGTTTRDDDAVTRHLDQLLALPYVQVDALRARRFRVALDCVRGAGAPIMLALLDRLGCDVTAIHTEADGRFPREPEPVAENLGELGGEDYTLAFAARLVLRHTPGTLVTNLSTSRVVEDAAVDAGQRCVRAPVGEANVASAMQAERAVIGGEGNGGVILPSLHIGRDAPAGAALVLQLLLETGLTPSQLVARSPRYVIVKDKLPRPAAPLGEVYAALQGEFAEASVDTQDGLRLSWPDRWVHVRPSGTEPIVRVIAEAPTRVQADALVARARVPLDALAATAV